MSIERPKRSKIWKISRDELLLIVSSSTSFTEILKSFGINNIGGNIATLKRRLMSDNIDFSHIMTGTNSNKDRKFESNNYYTTEDMLIENASCGRNVLKKRIIKENIIPYECMECGQLPLWNGKILCLVIDHKNGVRNDNRIENLRFLCPNCNSQTDTFCGRNKKYFAGSSNG